MPDLEELEALAGKHPALCEVSLSSIYEVNWSSTTLRCVVTDPRFPSGSYTGIPATLNVFTRERPFVQQEPIYYNRAYHRGGTIGKNMTVIGATDGTLTFLTLDAVNNCLLRHSTHYSAHKDCINAIWCEQADRTYIASSVCNNLRIQIQISSSQTY